MYLFTFNPEEEKPRISPGILRGFLGTSVCVCVFRLLPDRHVLAVHWFYLRADEDDRALPLTFDLSLSVH